MNQDKKGITVDELLSSMKESSELSPNHMGVWVLNRGEMHYCFKLIPVFHINEVIHEHMEEWK